MGIAAALVTAQTPSLSVEVVSKYSRVRSQPGENAQIVQLAKLGSRFTVLSSNGAWHQISLGGAKSGWIPAQDVKVMQGGAPAATTQPADNDKSLTISATYARVRSAPDRNAAFLVLVRRGERYDILEQKGSWYKISVEGKIGWVNPNESREAASAPTASAQSPRPGASQPAESTSGVRRPDSAKPSSEQTPLPSLSPTVDPSQSTAAETAKAATATAVSQGESTAPESSRPSLTKKAVNFFFKPAATPPPAEPQTMPEVEVTPVPLQSISELADTIPQQQLYVQITSSRQVPIREKLSPDSPILHFANNGATFPLVQAGESWCKIAYGDKQGWVERRFVKIMDTPNRPLFNELLVAVLVLIFLTLLAVLLWVLTHRSTKSKIGWFKTVGVEKNVMIISQKEKTLPRFLTNTPTSLSRCFSELGFKVTQTRDLKKAAQALVHLLPDVIMADWEMDTNVQAALEKFLSSKTSLANQFIIFYNVYDPVTVPRSRFIPNAWYLGPQFSDREIFSLVTPLLTRNQQNNDIRRSVETSALEGEIAENSLAEVFQFIEIGKRSGCLLVEQKKPFGIIYFKQGIIVYASTRNARGQDAVFSILGMKEGHFSLVLDKAAPEVNCSLPTLGILMEWTRRIDETRRR